MMPELGQVCLLLALLLAGITSIVPMIGSYTENRRMMQVASFGISGQFVFTGFAFVLLTYAFLVQDFSVLNVANNSNSELPIGYRFSAVWGSHEGSLMLWAFVHTIWGLALALFSASLPDKLRARVLSVMSMIGFGFLSFMIFTSNPFDRMVPPNLDGNDLNPLLQDFGLIIHPPMLYMGYVGSAVPFAFAIAALLENRVDQSWVRYCRPWTNIAWAFLTVGIALGSWWAYYELGWGGWWFWDPVENASFLPWLVGAALIHAQAVTEKRGTFRGWTLLLSIAMFSLSLLGTFLVRSGVITSVHSFASDPERGLFILVFLGIVTGGALLLFALRGSRVRVLSSAGLMSRETLLLVNNILLISSCALVMIGTLFPLLAEALNLGKYSVGAPWFGKMFALFSIPLLLLVPLGAFCRWNQDQLGRVLTQLLPAAGLAVFATGFTWLMAREMPIRVVLGLLVAFWVIAGTCAFLWRRWKVASGKRYTLEMLGMASAHLGLGLWLAGVVLVEGLSVERDVRLTPGEQVEVGPYTVKMLGVAHRSGANFEADRGRFEIYRGTELITELNPEKRKYRRGEVMTEADIRPHIFGDVYVALGEPLDDKGEAWGVRAYHKPFIRLIWLGALLMAFGGVLAAAERRLRTPVLTQQEKLSQDSGKNSGQIPGAPSGSDSNSGVPALNATLNSPGNA